VSAVALERVGPGRAIADARDMSLHGTPG
jgi:hypothetical protein